MNPNLRIVVADDEKSMREYLSELLPRLGHQVVVAENGRQLVELCRTAPPDLVITDIRMGDLDGLEAASLINRERPIPVILVSAYHDAELRDRAVEDHILAYLVKPVKQSDLEMAIGLAMLRFEQFRALRQEAADLRQALEDRKLIERAKGAVMRRIEVDESEAFRRLRKLASNHNRKLVQVARDVLEAEEVFQALDEGLPPGAMRHGSGGRGIDSGRDRGSQGPFRSPMSSPARAPAAEKDMVLRSGEGDR
jgi:response regulator NasT